MINKETIMIGQSHSPSINIASTPKLTYSITKHLQHHSKIFLPPSSPHHLPSSDFPIFHQTSHYTIRPHHLWSS